MAPLLVAITGLGVSNETQATLLASAEVEGALAFVSPQDDVRVLVYGPKTFYRTYEAALEARPHAFAHWMRTPPVAEGPHSLVDRAIELVAEGLTPYAAAKRIGVNVSAVYRAQRLRKIRGTCPCCGQLLPKEQS